MIIFKRLIRQISITGIQAGDIVCESEICINWANNIKIKVVTLSLRSTKEEP